MKEKSINIIFNIISKLKYGIIFYNTDSLLDVKNHINISNVEYNFFSAKNFNFDKFKYIVENTIYSLIIIKDFDKLNIYQRNKILLVIFDSKNFFLLSGVDKDCLDSALQNKIIMI